MSSFRPVADESAVILRRKSVEKDKEIELEPGQMSSTSHWRSFLCGFVVLAAVVEVTFRLLESHYTSYTRAHIARFHTIVKYELVTVLLSIFIWKRILSLFNAKGPSDHFRSLQKPTLQQLDLQRIALRRQRLVSILLGVTIASVHLSYFAYYIQLQFGLYRWLCWVALVLSGWYIHVGAMLIGFSLVNFVVRAVLFTQLGQKLTAPIFGIWGLKNLLTNAKWQTGISICVAAVFTLLGVIVTSGQPTINRVNIPLSRFPVDLKSFKIALISDIHLGPTVGREKLVQTVEVVNSMKPDLITIIGDLVDGSLDQLKSVAEPLRELKSKFGTYFTTGNHEYYYGNVDDWIKHLSSMGIRVLQNNSTVIDLGESKVPKTPHSLCLAGVDDISAEAYDIPHHSLNFESALQECTTSPVVILLAHNPIAARKAVDDKLSVDLILSGHTHGGQMYVTWPLAYLFLPFLHGLYWPTAETAVYVSSGVFYYAAPLKMFGLMEVAEIILEPKR